MKKTFVGLKALVVLFLFASCGSRPAEEISSDSAQQTTNQLVNPAETTTDPNAFSMTPESDSHALVVYFSWSGNTETVARSIQRQTASDLFEIVPVTPYSDDYDTVVDLAREEQRSNARPAISGSIEQFQQYDVIYVGFPNWWGDMPMILYTLFDTYDFFGKTIAPFCTSGGSTMEKAEEKLKALYPDVNWVQGKVLNHVTDQELENWLKDIL